MTKIKKQLDPFKTAALFIGKKDVRNYLNFIYSDGQTLTASDGSALIVIKHQAEPGYYDKNGEKIELDAKYPRFEKVFNDYTKAEPVELETGTKEHEKGELIAYAGQNFELWRVRNLQKIGIRTAYKIDNKLYFEGDSLKGVVMPAYSFGAFRN